MHQSLPWLLRNNMLFRIFIPISSDLALFQAIQRRSLAMDLTGLASYEVMKKWTDRLFSVYSQSVAPGFQKVSQSQLLRADRQAFVRLGELFSGSLKQGAGPGKALDPYIGQLENDVSVTYFMLPLPVSVNKVKNDDKPDKHPKKRPDANSQQQDTAAAHVEKVKKAKGLGKGKNKREPVPAALKGMHSRTPQGAPSVLDTISTSVLWERHVPESMYVRFQGVINRTLKVSISDRWQIQFHRIQRNDLIKKW